MMTPEVSLFGLSILEQFQTLAQQIAVLPEHEAIAVLNQGRKILHEVSPFKDHPVDFVEWIPSSQVEANDYNPNQMSPPEKKQLEKSLLDNGYAMPLVVINEKNQGDEGKECEIKRIVDGFHKSDLGKHNKTIRKQIKGHLPVCHIRPGRWALTDRMAATIQFNAHGEPSIQGLSDLVLKYVRKGWSDEQIAKTLVWEPDKVLRLRQQVGLADVWKDGSFREAWDLVDMNPLSKVLERAVIAFVACADWGGYSLACEVLADHQYQLSIDQVTKSGLFRSAQEVEESIQQILPSYEIGASLWYERFNEWENDDADLPDLVVPSPE